VDVTYRFDEFHVDPTRRLLFGQDGQPIPLKPRVFDTLLYLIEHRGELLEKHVLLDAIWPHVVVEENNLNQAISTLRRVFGETRSEHRFIVTEPGRGYRFVARVETVPMEPAGTGATASPGAAPPTRARSVAQDIPEAVDAGAGARVSDARLRAYVATVVTAGIAAALFWFANRSGDAWLNEELIPRIEMHLDVGDWEAAYALAAEAQQRIPDAPELLELWPRFSWLAALESDPPGAKVFRRAYDATDADWQELGRTPLTQIRIPFGLSRLRFELDGHVPLFRTLGGGVLVHADFSAMQLAPNLDASAFWIAPEPVKLDTPETLPEDMVRVRGWNQVIRGERVQLDDYFLHRYEVTNAEFKAFVDAGGYREPSFWDPVERGGEVITFEEAMTLFVDRTGRLGPSTWEAGHYPDGQEAFPVSGVSWYEAAAYARFKGGELPTAHHWRHALPFAEMAWLLPASNLDAAASVPVGQSDAMNYSGTFDMTGNVREWTATALGDRRLILGGGWPDEPTTAMHVTTTASPLDRSPANGLRLASTRDEPAVAEYARAPLPPPPELTPPDALPISDEVYAAYSRVFAYDRTAPLDASIETRESTRLWTRERISFDAAYDDERMVLYLYLPSTGSPPYQTVIYWPGSAATMLKAIEDYSRYLDFVSKSGRAVAFPVYKGTFERGGMTLLPSLGTTAYRDNVIAGINDLRRSIDYLETRPEIDGDSIAFFGHSWGGVNGAVVLAQEPRIRTAIMYVGWLLRAPLNPEVDPVYALPRVRQPVLMLNSEFDGFVPLENPRRYFELIGTPAKDKKHVITPGGHFVPRDVLIRETLDWLDDHLGPGNG
jgi:eukaryotic-like serine/threonine-protein kinase